VCSESCKHGSEWEGEDSNILSRPYPKYLAINCKNRLTSKFWERLLAAKNSFGGCKNITLL
ncbi:hypothetical protein, partial [Microcoleus sp. K4-C2]|uniref:hypothetical protein n=1 Tax=Microcoleus sp. K4-C2 TaxID=2818792 RepID=UPI002FD46B4C